MERVAGELGDSTHEQELLRAVALWAADCAERALPVFERHHPTDMRPREAIAGGRAFGQGQKRGKHLRIVALAAFRAGKDVDAPSIYAARAASLTAAVAYTHTDLQTGRQGIRQARHIIGPAVYAALALETAADDDPEVGDDAVQRAIASAPAEVRQVLKHMPPQPKERDRLSVIFSDLDSALRGS